MKKIFLSSVLLAIISGCSKDNMNTQVNITGSKISSWQALSSSKSLATISVVNQFNQPIANAKVLIGQAVGSPFKNNFLTTDKNGQIQNISDWKTTEHVTAEAAGYIRQTVLAQKPGTLTIKLNPAQLTNKAVIMGQVTQLPIVDRDKNIDFGLVMSALTKADLLNFDLNSVISPISDVMKVANQTIPVPTNVSLPKQKENYIIGLTIEKPDYRFFSSTLGTRRLFAAAGRFPFKAVVDELRAGKPFYDVINYFDLQGGGIRDVTLTGASTKLDIPGNELKFTSPVSIASPNLNPDEIFVALSASEVSGFLIPTGIKKMGTNETASLNVLDQKPTFTVNVIKRQSEFMAQTSGADRLSVAMLPYQQNAKPNMLPLINDPSVTNSNGYMLTLPTPPTTNGIYALAVSAVISDLQISGPADKPATELIRQWEILGNQWPTKIELPNWPLASANKKRFEINLIGGIKNQSVDLGDALINAATHVTHASTDF
jgi:hypothetical protein